MDEGIRNDAPRMAGRITRGITLPPPIGANGTRGPQ
ncbi:hypothetical protein N787_08225 [Arenimonas metalli CF5-1]|uniref:Uncharacterized protein n=1 Tax=Arenimonas metalli CF5-1 TaxID=1384056 RepID=A0A091B7R2_9GAMM|nr:hypothetical protein N787_08225 [Arenimonas metalli CF5-1]